MKCVRGRRIRQRNYETRYFFFLGVGGGGVGGGGGGGGGSRRTKSPSKNAFFFSFFVAVFSTLSTPRFFCRFFSNFWDYPQIFFQIFAKKSGNFQFF